MAVEGRSHSTGTHQARSPGGTDVHLHFSSKSRSWMSCCPFGQYRRNESRLIPLLRILLTQTRYVPLFRPSSFSWEVTYIINSVSKTFFYILNHLWNPRVLAQFIALLNTTPCSFFTWQICAYSLLLQHKWLLKNFTICPSASFIRLP